MKVTNLTDSGGPDGFVLAEVSAPPLLNGSVRLRVAAAGINRADALQRDGRYPPPPGAPAWPGLEVAGWITDVADGVGEWKAGDAVCALLPGGGYAEECVVDAGLVLPVPDGLSMIEAAALVETACTVWSNLRRADARAGETLLVHGGSGGVGTTAIQIGVAMGMRVIVTARGTGRCARCVALGATVAIDYTSEDFAERVTELGGADVILDVVGGAYLDRNLRALRTGGRLVVIGLQGGAAGEIDLGRLVKLRGSVIGTTLRARPLDERRAIVAEVLAHVWPWVPARVRPIIHGTFPLEQVSDAHRLFDSGEVFGKLVLTTDAL